MVLAALGKFSLWGAVLVDVGAALLVIGNGMLILRWRRAHQHRNGCESSRHMCGSRQHPTSSKSCHGQRTHSGPHDHGKPSLESCHGSCKDSGRHNHSVQASQSCNGHCKHGGPQDHLLPSSDCSSSHCGKVRCGAATAHQTLESAHTARAVHACCRQGHVEMVEHGQC